MLNITSNLLDSYQGNHGTLIRTFYLVVQVTHLLMAGQVGLCMYIVHVYVCTVSSFPGHTHTYTHTLTHTHKHTHTQVKAAKPHLKQLQQKVKALGAESQTLSDQSDFSRQSPDYFQWLTIEQTYVLVYLVSKFRTTCDLFSSFSNTNPPISL